MPGAFVMVFAAAAVAVTAPAGVSIPMTRTVGAVRAGTARIVDPAAGRVEAKGVMRPTRGDVELTMLDVLTYCTVDVGSSMRRMNVIVDTGSSTLAVPSDLCQPGATCVYRCPECFYNRSLSTSYARIPCQSRLCKASVPTCAGDEACHFTVQYTDRSGETGDLVRDTVGFGPFAAEMTFGAMQAISPPNEFARLGVDGILGIGGKRLNYNIPTILDEIVAAYSLPDIFAMSVGEQGVPGSGVLNLGGIDPSQYITQIQWTSMSWDTWYVVRPLAMSVGNDSVAQSEYDFGYMSIVDSGTTFTFLPYPLYARIRKLFREKYSHLPHVTSASGSDEGTIFQSGLCYSNMRLDLFPVLHFYFDGAAVSIPATSYFTKATQGRTTYYCFGISPSGGRGAWTVPMQQTILGDTFMAALYVVFNRENSSMGFAQRQPVPPAPPLPDGALAVADAGTVVFVIFIVLCVAFAVFVASRPGHAGGDADARGVSVDATTPLAPEEGLVRLSSRGPKRQAVTSYGTV